MRSLSKVYAAIYGSGLGHVTRSLSIIERLRSGNSFSYSSFDDGYALLKSMGESVYSAPSLALAWDESGGVSGEGTFLGFPIALATFARQVSFELDTISRINPKVVLSDSRLSTVIAAKMKHIPSVTILNQLKILLPPRFKSGVYSTFLERIEGDILGLLWTLSDKVLFPDLPPPYTIGEANFANVDVAGKVDFTGFMIPKIQERKEDLDKVKSTLELQNNRPLVYIQISGPKPTKSHFTNIVMDSIPLISDKNNLVISLGLAGGSETARKIGNKCWLFDWCPMKDELFVLSDLLVTRAGHSTLSQCVNGGKVAVVVPISNQSEQLWNAKKFESLGLGLKVNPQDLSPKSLSDAIDNCLQDQAYVSNAEKVRLISDKYDGIAKATEILSSFL